MTRPKIPIVTRFWNKVDIRGMDECWDWQGAKDRLGYGLVRDGNSKGAHIVAWEMANGPRPVGMDYRNEGQIRHTCDNPGCCNPNHLEIGTRQQNADDRVNRGRSPKGEKSGRALLKECYIRAIREDPRPQREIALWYGVRPHVIHQVKARKSWKHVE